MAWVRSAMHQPDLTFGLMLSICLGIILGLLMGHPLGTVLLLYVLSYSIGAIWMIGTQQGLVVVTVFVWCMLLSSALGGGLKLPILAGFPG
jgi:hypothetical protein